MKRLTLYILPFIIISCINNDNKRSAYVTIDTGVRNKTISRAPAPSEVSAISLTISASDMETRTETIPADTGTISLEAQAGAARVFSVSAVTNTGIYYTGSATADLNAGETVNLSITMTRYDPRATLTIKINFPNGTPATISSTCKLTYAVAGSAPVTITNFTSGEAIPDIPILVESQITLEAATPSATFKGTTSVVPAGDQSVTVNLYLFETKIVVPDYNFISGPPSYTNGRLVQIDDMNGAGWTIVNVSNYTSTITTFRPYDVDFDYQGRIYIANNAGVSGMGNNCVMRVNDISDNSPYLYPDAATRSSLPFYDGGVVAIAVDRNNNYIYYALNNLLFRANIGNNLSHAQITLPAITFYNIRGLAVDNSGSLYITDSGTGASPAPYLYKYDTQGNTFSYNANLNTPWDVMVKSNYLYIASYDINNLNNKIIRLNLDLPFGSQTAVELSSLPGTTDPFAGPHRFLALLNSRFYLIDEREDGTVDRLVSFDDFSSITSTTFVPTSIGETAFRFYAC